MSDGNRQTIGRILVTPQGELVCTLCGHRSRVEVGTWYSIQNACPHNPQPVDGEQEGSDERQS